MESEEKKEDSSREIASCTTISRQLEEIHEILKQIYDAFLQFQETDREFVSEEGLLLEEALAKERKEQENEHSAMRLAFREKTRKEQDQTQTRLLRKARSLVADQNKNSQVWDSSSSTMV